MAINATAVWRVRPSGSNVNGGGYDAAISGAGTDYSQQNSAQAIGTHGTASGTTAFSDTTAAAFTSAMIGNAIWIASGSGFTVGAYFVTAFTDSSHVTLDRSPGTGTVAVWKLGGGWADFWTNVDPSRFAAVGAPVPGNTVFILGSGTPNPSSYVYDYAQGANFFTPPAGNATAGSILFANDPATPGYKAPPDTTGGMPTIQAAALSFFATSYCKLQGLYFVASGAANGASVFSSTKMLSVFGCVFDQFAFDISGVNTGAGSAYVAGCEVFSSTSPGAAGAGYALGVQGANGLAFGCNVHDAVGGGIQIGNSDFNISNCIVAKCRITGISVHGGTEGAMSIVNNTIDGNLGSGIDSDNGQNQYPLIMNNIISNHNQAGKFGLSIDNGTATQNSKILPLADYNIYYNNTANYNGINAGPHDTALGITPYVGSATENYTLA